MCGEMAGDIMSIPILLGLGLDAFSMSATSIPRARMIINSLSYKDCQDIALKCIDLSTQKDVNQTIKQFLSEKKLVA
jgi:phosphotransferase system enzyme I (PtsI)